VPNVLDVSWRISTDRSRSNVSILGFLIEDLSEGLIVVDCGMRDPQRAVDILPTHDWDTLVRGRIG